ncbi:hypothetical protein ELG65_15860 [Rhizobium leguminosarum]|uniref:Eco57I restriction-modification methylase domain-containing protein n=1 Tax=Rhizobium leguminosarum TaxID=384 RepID=UPI0010304B4D|nr:DNA methyltransferase [Rhizobium leguminosarum]TBH59775.1 hypothetical protein ELG65_15860 [Rhizobium leguminosarum]
MNALFDSPVDPQLEWLYHVGPIGLVIGPNVIRQEGLIPPRQTAVDSETIAEVLDLDDDGAGPIVSDPWAFFERILGWEARYVAGALGGPLLPSNLAVRVDEHDVVLSPDWAVRDLGVSDAGAFQLLVKFHPLLQADERGSLAGWQATPHQQFERLLRETGVAIGVLIDRSHLRLVYAPRGETSGWLSFPLRSLVTVAGRAMLGGLKMMLGHSRLFTEPEARRLPKLLSLSREAQNKVSAELAEQVLGALHELLRAFHAADAERIEKLAQTQPHHLYEGLLTTLMRLVFLLYAEDRELIPTMRTGEAVEIYEQGYSVRGLYTRLTEDRALYPDTMDERVGGWGRLLALFRLVHGGHRSGWITARGGKLFDPEAFPFLEGRDQGTLRTEAKVLQIRDGAILRILEGLMTIEARAMTGERVRERLSYRSLDVEQIGSVYETIMGFTVFTASGLMIAVKGEKNLPVFIDVGALATKNGADRQKHLKEAGVAPTGRRLEAIKKAETVENLTEALAAIADLRGSPGGHVTMAGSPILQPTDERRRSGSHYTPRSLTEPIVRHALEPAFDRIGEDATPDQVLEIKVCDPACGSGAFLVEACRQLGERLEKAWGYNPELKPRIPADEDDALHARRLVAQRSLYGVDKNPLAVDLARLSLWLATLAREHEFTFLDHSIKSGDSLVGLTRAQIEAVHWDVQKAGVPLLRGLIRDRVNEAATGRRDIQFAPDDVSRAIQEARHSAVERRLEQPRTYGDAIVAAFFSEDKPKAREQKRQEVESLLSGASTPQKEDRLVEIATSLKHGEHPIRPFHWELEFPEVFSRDNPGLDAIVGNPPFLGGTNISGANGSAYRSYINDTVPESHGKGDLCAHFFRRASLLVREGGVLGLIATNTISQGATREMSLRVILRNDNSKIIRAIPRLRWPGPAAVIVSVIHILRQPSRFARQPLLGTKHVGRVSAYLVAGGYDESPQSLARNDGLSFTGTKIYGNGFTFDDNDSKGLATPISKMRDILNSIQNSDMIIKPYLGGEEANSDPEHRHRRFVVDFGDMPLRRDPTLSSWSLASEEYRENWVSTGLVPSDYPFSTASDWPELLQMVERNVRPERLKSKNVDVRKYPWWKYWRPRTELYRTIGLHSHCLVANAGASPHHAIARLPVGSVFSHALAVFAFSNLAPFATLQSRVHEIWARFFSSSMKDDLRYAPSDCFETFPFPRDFEVSPTLEAAGQTYHDYRAELMVNRQQGMTKTYNRFHNANETAGDIVRLRTLHAEMDRAVLAAYGWEDLANSATPQFLTEETEAEHTYRGRLFWPSDVRDEVLARLLKLNAELHQDEVRLGLAKGEAARQKDDDEEDFDD